MLITTKTNQEVKNVAQVNITLSQEEVLQFLSGNRDEGFKMIVERIMNQIMLAESAEQLGAQRHERSDERRDYRNGIRERELNTRIGTLTLEVPRHRNEPFHTMVFENYSRSEASLIATMVQMVVCGVSTRKVEKVVQELCGTSFSKSAVSELCKKLDHDIEDFRSRPLDTTDAPFLMVDATYFKVREDHRIISKAFLVALAIKNDGTREVAGFGVYDSEDNYSWKDFFEGLKGRGLRPEVIISDAHRSIKKSVVEVFPGTAWQRCQVHLLRNILDATPPKYTEGLRTELRSMFTSKSIEEARRIKEEIVSEYETVAARAMDILEKGFEDSMTVYGLPEYIRITVRTTNILERMNREFKRRSDVIQIFPNSGSVLRLMGAVAIECSEAMAAKQRLYSEKAYMKYISPMKDSFRKTAERQLAEIKAA